MRALLVAAIMLCVACPTEAAPKKKKRQRADPNPAVEEVAREVFKSHDRNRNDALSRTEFRSAEKEVQSRLMQLAKQGVLGSAKGKDVELTAGATDRAKLEKSNKVTQDEFTSHVRHLAQQVNIAALQQSEIVAAQQRKAQAAKKAAAKRRANNARKR